MTKSNLDDQLRELQLEAELREGLPHLYGYRWYRFQLDFINSVNRDNLLCAANQLGKSCCSVSKCIHWATDKTLWPKLWHTEPRTFAYLYPSLKLATTEFEEKWVKDLLPRGKFKDHPEYGWRSFYRNGDISCIEFKSGVTIYFYSYSQDASDLQAVTLWAIFTDEELPAELYPEIIARLRATRGYFHMVFTATLGQEYWKRAIEGKGEEESFKNAWKRQVSLYDCTEHADGTPSQWTVDRIEEEKLRCGTQQEVDRRIYGKFVRDGGLKVPTFDRAKHVKDYHMLPVTWHRYSGVDVGGGVAKSKKNTGHLSSIVFLAVNPERTRVIVYDSWRGDNMSTTATDVLNQYIEMRGEQSMTGQFYDWASKEFSIISGRCGENFIPADKSIDRGKMLINTLFKNNMLEIMRNGEYEKLCYELATIPDVDKSSYQTTRDDLYDAMRYALTGASSMGNFDFTSVIRKRVGNRIDNLKSVNNLSERDEYIKQRRNGKSDEQIELERMADAMGGTDEYFAEWGEMYES